MSNVFQVSPHRADGSHHDPGPIDAQRARMRPTPEGSPDRQTLGLLGLAFAAASMFALGLRISGTGAELRPACLALFMGLGLLGLLTSVAGSPATDADDVRVREVL